MNKTTRQIFALASITLVTLVGIMAGTATVYAQGAGAGGRQGGFGGRQGRQRQESSLAAGLKAADLTDAQKTQIKTITDKYKEERKVLLPQPAAGGAVSTERARPTPELRTKLTDLETRETADVKAVLTPDQQTKFQTAYDAAKASRGNGNILTGFAEKLKLTEDQKAKVTPILTDLTDTMKKIREDDSIERRDKAEKMMSAWNDAKEKIRPILTADQQKSLDEIKMRGGRGGGQRGGGRRGGFGGGAPAPSGV